MEHEKQDEGNGNAQSDEPLFTGDVPPDGFDPSLNVHG